MSNAQNSLYGSSVRSYKNLDNVNNKKEGTNFVKFLHTQYKYPHEPAQNYDYTPIIARNKSYDTFNSKVFDRPSKDPNMPISQRFYQSIENSSSQQKYINQISNLQNEITKLMANQLGIKTEKDMLLKEAKRLKEEIDYLNSKCTELEGRNEELFKSKSKMSILEREYNKVLVEYEQFKSNCRIMHDPSSLDHITNQPTKIQPNYENEEEKYQYFRLKDKEVGSRLLPSQTSHRFNGKINQKVSWKRTSAAISPIHKLDNLRKYSGNRFQDLSLIQSKIDKYRDEEMVEQRQNEYYGQQKDHTKTIDLKDLEKIKEYDSNIRTLELQLKELRNKNIALYKKGEQFEHQKMKLLQTINEQNYEKSKIVSQQKTKQNQLKKQLQKVKLEVEERKIKIIQLNEIIESKSEAIKLLAIQKAEIEQNGKKQIGKTQKDIKQLQQQAKSIAQLKQTVEKSQKQLIALKQRWTVLNKRHQQLQIENKLHMHELQEKKTQIIDLQGQISKLKDQQAQKHLILEEESLLSKTQNKIQADYKKQQREEGTRAKSIQTDADGSMGKVIEELTHLKQNHQRLANEHNLWGFQLNKLRNHNAFINDNYLKLTNLFELQKAQNNKLRQLGAAWREIEVKMKTMKHIDSTVDHLWQIKEVQYQNLHQILQKVAKL